MKIPKKEFSLAYIPHRSLLELRGLRTKKRKRNTTKQSIITYLTPLPTPTTFGHEKLTKAFAKCGDRPAA